MFNTKIKIMYPRVFVFVLFAFFAPLVLGVNQALSLETLKIESELSQDLTTPIDLALTSEGNMFVLDAGVSSVLVLDAQGKQTLSFGGNGSGEGQLLNPRAIALSPNNKKVIVADTGNNRAVVYNSTGEFLFQFGSMGTSQGQFQFISGVAADSFGFIYLSDRDNKRVQVFSPNGIFMKELGVGSRAYDVSVDPGGNVYALLSDVGKVMKFSPEGRKISEISCKVNSRDEIAKAGRIEVDSKGDIFLIQQEEQRIVKIDQAGHILITFGSEGNARGQFLAIAGLAADEGNRVYIADSGNKRIQVFAISGPKKLAIINPVTSSLLLDFETTITVEEGISGIYSRPGWGLLMVSDKNNHIITRNRVDSVYGSEGPGAGQLSKPASLYVTLDGRIFVADTGNNRVEIFNPDGTLNYQFGKEGAKAGQFSSPQGIAVNSKGMIFVADTMNNRVQVFNQDGIYLSAIGQPDITTRAEGCQYLHSPQVIAVNSQDHLYVLDADSNEVRVFDENGECLKTIGGKGNGPGQFTKAVNLAIDENDNLYVADQGTSRVHVFDARGKFLLAFGSTGVGNGYFQQISSVAASEGKVYVADYQSDQVQVFKYSPDGLNNKPERLYSTKTAAPFPGMDGNDVMRYTMARKLALSDAIKEFTDNFGFSKDYLLRFVRIESIESMRDGQVKVTISIPKYIPKEIKPVDTALR